jgi:hypothetical protein
MTGVETVYWLGVGVPCTVATFAAHLLPAPHRMPESFEARSRQRPLLASAVETATQRW